jgi:hypothetical protein
MVINVERLAWDGARAVVRTLEDDRFEWLSGRVGDLLGPERQMALSDSYSRLSWRSRSDAPMIEAGLWRAWLVELLHTRPELAGPLERLISEANENLQIESR